MTDPANGGAPARTTTFDRNADGTIAERTLHSGAAGTSVIDEWAYTYDATSRVASRNRSGGAGTLNEVLGYDEAARLSTINSNPVSYDPNGNRLSGPGMPTQTFRADNAIATGPGANGNGTEAYQYTPWGGLTRDACKTYNYDGFDRAHKTTLRQNLDLVPRCNALGDLLRANDEKRYDPLGRNVWARHDRLSVLGQPTLTEYQNLYPVGLGQDTAYEHTVGDADRSGRYVNTPDGTPLAVTDLNGDYQFLHRDGQGNTVAAINPGGSVACGPELDPWGEGADECDNLLTPATPNRKWYNSSRLDTTTETYQWGTRTYNPETATWQQPDTAALSGAPDNVSIGTDPLVANRYAYVNGDPINYTDPSGHILIEGNESQPSGSVQRTGAAVSYIASASTTESDCLQELCLSDAELWDAFLDLLAESSDALSNTGLIPDGVCTQGQANATIVVGPVVGLSGCLVLLGLRPHLVGTVEVGASVGLPNASVTVGAGPLFTNASDPEQLRGPSICGGGAAAIEEVGSVSAGATLCFGIQIAEDGSWRPTGFVTVAPELNVGAGISATVVEGTAWATLSRTGVTSASGAARIALGLAEDAGQPLVDRLTEPFRKLGEIGAYFRRGAGG